MKLNQMFPSTYIKADDVKGREVPVIIDRVTFEEVEEGKPDKPIMHFRNAKRGMVLNRTNAAEIGKHYGEDTDHWIGKPIVILVENVLFKGKMVPGLRVRVPVTTAATNPSPPPAPLQQYTEVNPPPFEDLDDEIPF